MSKDIKMTIDELIKILESISKAVEGVKEKPDREIIDEIREILTDTLQDFSDLIDVFGETLFEAELAAIEAEIERDQKEIESDKEEDQEDDNDVEHYVISWCKETKADSEALRKKYKEVELVEAGETIGADVDIKYNKKTNSENLYAAIFKGE